ncbi:MAG TPA: hypothetical protein VF074_16030, partial [Pyrinomonadaceae bacterium]
VSWTGLIASPPQIATRQRQHYNDNAERSQKSENFGPPTSSPVTHSRRAEARPRLPGRRLVQVDYNPIFVSLIPSHNNDVR